MRLASLCAFSLASTVQGSQVAVKQDALPFKTHFCRFLVTEGRERVGGNITSVSGNGYRWEEGPSSFQPNDAMLKAAVSFHRCHQDMLCCATLQDR